MVSYNYEPYTQIKLSISIFQKVLKVNISI